jgi:hypothetical protein
MTPDIGVDVRGLAIVLDRVKGAVNWFCDSHVKDDCPEDWVF